MKKIVHVPESANHNKPDSVIETDTTDSMVVASSKPVWTRYVSVQNIAMLIFAVSVVSIALEMRKPIEQTKTMAAAGKAAIVVQPATVTLSSQKTLQIWATVDKKVGFIRVNVSFDPTKLALVTAPSFSVPSMNKVTLTTKEAANASGHIIFATGIDPNKIGSAPTGTFQIGSLVFAKKANNTNGETAVRITINDSQFVDMDAVPFVLTSTGSTVTIHPSQQAGLMASGSPTRSPTPTRTPTPSHTPTPTRSTTVTLTRTPTPTIGSIVVSKTPIPTVMVGIGSVTPIATPVVPAEAQDPFVPELDVFGQDETLKQGQEGSIPSVVSTLWAAIHTWFQTHWDSWWGGGNT